MRKTVKKISFIMLALAFVVGWQVAPASAAEGKGQAEPKEVMPTSLSEEPTDYFIDEFDMTDYAITTSRNYHGNKMKMKVKAEGATFNYIEVVVQIVGFPKEYIYTVPSNGEVLETDNMLIGFEYGGNQQIQISFRAKGDYHIYLETYSWSE